MTKDEIVNLFTGKPIFSKIKKGGKKKGEALIISARDMTKKETEYPAKRKK